MKSWQIGVLVAICVVFVAAASLILFLIYRYGNWRTLCSAGKAASRYAEERQFGVTDAYSRLYIGDLRIRPSGHILYFIDFHGELKWIDFSKKPASRIRTEDELQRYIWTTFAPVLTTAMAENVALARQQVPEALALSYVDCAQNVVVMDIFRLLLRDDEYTARMRLTAERPLLLSWLVEDPNQPVITVLDRYRATATPQASHDAARTESQQSINVQLENYRSNPMSPPPSAATSPKLGHAPAASSVPPFTDYYATRSLTPIPSPAAVAEPGSSAPTPVIHPVDAHEITTRTPVFITAASYTVFHANGSQSALEEANVIEIEAARAHWDHQQSLAVLLRAGSYAGYRCMVDPVTDAAHLVPQLSSSAAASRAREVVVRSSADTSLYYTIERVSSTQWLLYEHPLQLPAGKWCVQAKAVSLCDGSSKTTSKIFVVNVI